MNETHRNNFDFIRFLAAAMVWYDHCYALKKLQDPLASQIRIESFGSLGVAIFFIISGYFITASYDKRAALMPFIRNRILRIFPAMAVVILLSVFVLGPCVTSLNWHDYFASTQTWRYLRSLLVFPLQYNLPGVFINNPVPAVNGSLWTLQHEIRLYGCVALFGLLGVLRPRVALLLCVAVWAIRLYGVIINSTYSDSLFIYFWHLSWHKIVIPVQLGGLFAGGALMYLARNHIMHNALFFMASVVCMIVAVYIPHGEMLFEAALIYAVIYLGFLRLPLLPSFGKYGDFSYGMYLYAFPIQQLSLQVLGYTGNFTTFLIVSFAATLLCAVLSWHYVEQPTLRLKRQ